MNACYRTNVTRHTPLACADDAARRHARRRDVRRCVLLSGGRATLDDVTITSLHPSVRQTVGRARPELQVLKPGGRPPCAPRTHPRGHNPWCHLPPTMNLTLPPSPPALGQQCACLPLPCATQRASDSHPRVRTTQGNSQPCLQWVFPIYVRARY